MWYEILTAAIAAAAAIFGSMLTHNKSVAVLRTMLESLHEEVDNLTKRVEKQSDMFERIYKLEEKVNQLEKKSN